MLICGMPTAALFERGAGAMQDYLTDQMRGRVFRRQSGALRSLALAFLGIEDPAEYRVDEVIPPVHMEDRPNPDNWKVQSTIREGHSVQLDLTALALPFDTTHVFARQFEYIHRLARPCALLLNSDAATHPPLPTAHADCRRLVRRPRNLVASLEPAYGRPSFLEAERLGADRWYMLQAGLYYQLGDQLVGKIKKAQDNFQKATDATYRSCAFALASYGCAQASLLTGLPKLSELIRLIREWAEFCFATYQDKPKFDGTITASWAMLAAGSLVQRLAYAIRQLFGEAATAPGKQSNPRAAVRKWRECTGDRLQALPTATTDDTRLRTLVARARNLLDRPDIDGQRLASLSVETLEFWRQAVQARATLSTAYP